MWQRWRIPHGKYCYKIISIEKDPPVIRTMNCPYWECKDNYPDQACGYCYLLGRGDMDVNLDKSIILTNIKTGEKLSAPEMPFGIGLLWDKCKECGIRTGYKKYEEL